MSERGREWKCSETSVDVEHTHMHTKTHTHLQGGHCVLSPAALTQINESLLCSEGSGVNDAGVHVVG